MAYVFPALFTATDDGWYAIRFPDLPGTNSQGRTMEEALFMARDALVSWLDFLQSEGKEIPNPSSPSSFATGKNQFVSLIDADLDAYKRRQSVKAVKKTLTLPSWLNEEAEAAGINFSQVLQEALKEKLEVNV